MIYILMALTFVIAIVMVIYGFTTRSYSISRYTKEINIRGLGRATMSSDQPILFLDENNQRVIPDYEERFADTVFVGWRSLVYVESVLLPFNIPSLATIFEPSKRPKLETYDALRSWNREGHFVRAKYMAEMPLWMVEVIETIGGYDVCWREDFSELRCKTIFTGQTDSNNYGSYDTAAIINGCTFRYRHGALWACLEPGTGTIPASGEEKCYEVEFEEDRKGIMSPNGAKRYVDVRDPSNQCRQMYQCDPTLLQEGETRYIDGSLCAIDTNKTAEQKWKDNVEWIREGFGAVGETLQLNRRFPRMEELVGLSCSRPIYLPGEHKIIVKVRHNKLPADVAKWVASPLTKLEPICGDIDYLFRNPSRWALDGVDQEGNVLDCRKYSSMCCNGIMCQQSLNYDIEQLRVAESRLIQDNYPDIFDPNNSGIIEIAVGWTQPRMSSDGKGGVDKENYDLVSRKVLLYPSAETTLYIDNIAIDGLGNVRWHYDKRNPRALIADRETGESGTPLAIANFVKENSNVVELETTP
jgi:hypothetical protein